MGKRERKHMIRIGIELGYVFTKHEKSKILDMKTTEAECLLILATKREPS